MTMKHGRLPWYERASLDDAQRAIYERVAGGVRAQGPQAFPLTDDAGRLHGPFNGMLTSPSIGGALERIGAAIRFESQLGTREREIGILEVAALRRADFEWYAHERVGRKAGLTEPELDALRTGADAPTLSPREALLRAVVRACIRDRALDDATFAAAEAEFGTRALYDLVTLAGYYDLLALTMAVWQTPLPAGERSPFS
jgi:alkylhydroperoxidase family enzyme